MVTNFFQRWSSRKLTAVESPESTLETIDDSLGLECEDINANPIDTNATIRANEDELTTSSAVASYSEVEETVVELTIADADKVTYDSGVASFMQQQVTKSVKKAALRKLFHSEEFNYISDMDDSTEDFSNMQGLAPEIASQMRGWVNTVTETATEALKNDDISALTSSDALHSMDPISNKDLEDEEFVHYVDTTHTDKEALPTTDLSLTPIIDCDIKNDEQKS